MKLTKARLRALKAVEAGRVRHRMTARGNQFIAPAGVGDTALRNLLECGFIEYGQGIDLRLINLTIDGAVALLERGLAHVISPNRES